jgi:carboxymethylenebutenolidase
MDQRIIALYDDFTHRHLDRRLFIEQAGRLLGGTAAAIAALSLLQSNRALGQIVAPDDARLRTMRIIYPGATGPVKAYLARPVGDARLPGIVVIHENRGLMPHIQDVARRVALAGYVALAPDLMSASGGTPDDEDKARVEFAKVDLAVARKDAASALAYLKSRPDASGRVGAVGFCWGGGMVNYLATASADLDAGVVYYGGTPPREDVGKIKAPLLLHYAGLDEQLTATVPAYEEALKAEGKSYTLYVYPGVNHAFNNDTGAARYDKAAASLAWERTLAFFDKALKGA